MQFVFSKLLNHAIVCMCYSLPTCLVSHRHFHSLCKQVQATFCWDTHKDQTLTQSWQQQCSGCLHPFANRYDSDEPSTRSTLSLCLLWIIVNYWWFRNTGEIVNMIVYPDNCRYFELLIFIHDWNYYILYWLNSKCWQYLSLNHYINDFIHHLKKHKKHTQTSKYCMDNNVPNWRWCELVQNHVSEMWFNNNGELYLIHFYLLTLTLFLEKRLFIQ